VLPLTVRIGESVMIGDEIEIHVREKHGQRVQLTIAAPLSLKILRRALWQRQRGPASAEPEKRP
jgi:carbon storage regulator CsrA